MQRKGLGTRSWEPASPIPALTQKESSSLEPQRCSSGSAGAVIAGLDSTSAGVFFSACPPDAPSRRAEQEVPRAGCSFPALLGLRISSPGKVSCLEPGEKEASEGLSGSGVGISRARCGQPALGEDSLEWSSPCGERRVALPHEAPPPIRVGTTAARGAWTEIEEEEGERDKEVEDSTATGANVCFPWSWTELDLEEVEEGGGGSGTDRAGGGEVAEEGWETKREGTEGEDIEEAGEGE